MSAERKIGVMKAEKLLRQSLSYIFVLLIKQIGEAITSFSHKTDLSI